MLDLIAWALWPNLAAAGGQDQPAIAITKVLIGIITCYLCVSFILQTKDDIRFVIPYVEFARQVKGQRPVILDTSVIIDGRIADICETGIIDQKLIVPRFVPSRNCNWSPTPATSLATRRWPPRPRRP